MVWPQGTVVGMRSKVKRADCMAAIAALRRAASERETADAARYREMVDYYTAWVHQIKTPIAAMRLTLQPDDTPNARRLMSQLLRIEQYVDMVLMYLRLDEGTSDYVIRACDLDGIIRQSLRKFAGEFIDRKLTLHYEPLHLSVVTDEKWLGFVVEQVLSNALKYTPEGGSITIDAETPATLCRTLTAAGLGQAHALVGEQLGTPEEKIFFGTAQEVSQKSTASLSVLLIEHLPQPPRRCAGFPDEAFLRGDVPMTKQEVRAAALAKLAVRPTDTLWDVGAGTGSVSVELALAAPRGRVYAVECDPEACALIRKNRERFAAWNLTLIEGKAPQALEALPAPDAVFLGGTKGSMEAVVDAVLAKNPQARLCISAIALETLSAAVAALTARGLTAEVTQIAVSRTKPAGRLHLLMANNPIFLITGERQ